MSTKAISLTETGTLVAAAAGRTVMVFSYKLNVTTETVVRWDSTSGTALSGNLTIPAKGEVNAEYNPGGHFQAPAGEGIKLTYVSGTGVIGGHMSYDAP